MDVSYAVPTEVCCAHCFHTFQSDIWLLVDVTARRDLLKATVEDKITSPQCPNCQRFQAFSYMPLLIYAAGDPPRLIFSPASGTVDELSQGKERSQLVKLLLTRLNRAGDEGWLEKSLYQVPRDQLAQVVADLYRDRLAVTGKQPNIERNQHKTDSSVRDPVARKVSDAKKQQSEQAGQGPEHSRFLLRLFDAIELSQDVERVNQFLFEHLHEINDDLLQKLPDTVSMLLARVSSDQKVGIAYIACLFAGIIQQFPGGNRDINLELSIAAYESALPIINREVMPHEWARLMNNLAETYRLRLRGDRAENMERAIEYLNQSLSVRRRETKRFEWAESKLNLAVAYATRIRGEHSQNIEQSIALFKEALQVITRDEMPMIWAQAMSNLAAAYASRPLGNKPKNMEVAISALEDALQILTPERAFPLWGQAMSSLANAYGDRILGDRADNIEKSIETSLQLSQTMTREMNPIDWSLIMMNLATAYIFRIRGDKAENIESAIAYYQQSLLVRTRRQMPFDWADSMMGLATAYRERIVGDKSENIERAISIHQQALQVRTREDMPLEWATSMTEFANVYLDRIEGDRGENIEVSIEAYHRALEVITMETMPLKWATAKQNLANAYSDRIKGDRAQNLEQAITACQQSLQVRTRESLAIEWAQSMLTLGNAYARRMLGDSYRNLQQAKQAYQQSREIITEDANPVVWAELTGNLANVYRTLSESRFPQNKAERAQNIEHALDLYQQAQRVITRAALPLSWSRLMRNMAITYLDRIQGDRRENIEAAIDFQQRSLNVRTRLALPIEWAESVSSLADAYAVRIEGDQTQNRDKAIAYYQQALEIYSPDGLPNECRRTARLLGNLFCRHQRWCDAVDAYQKGLQATEILYQSSLLRGSQEAELTETDDLFRRAAYAYAKVGDLTSAVITVEQGKARKLSDTLAQDRTDLTQLKAIAPDVFSQYQQAVLAIRALESRERTLDIFVTENLVTENLVTENLATNRPDADVSTIRQRAEAVHQQFNDAIALIREQAGYERFLMTADWEDIATAVEPTQPLIYLLLTPNGGLALVVSKPETEDIQISPLWLDDFTAEVQTKLFFAGEDSDWAGWFGGHSQQSASSSQWKQTIDRVTQQLWDVMMAPIVNELIAKQLTHAILIPTSYLSFLPLHAAWCEDAQRPTSRRYALDDVTFAYAPNARSLSAARAIADKTLADALLAVSHPQPTKQHALRYASREIEAAIAYFPRHIALEQTQASRESVLSALPHSNILHFSCHGHFSFNQPLSSGLLLSADRLLTLQDILDVPMKGIRLAVLSACETGVSGTQLPDEVVSLPAGLLQAGVAGIAASLWSVSDMSTMLLIRRFYDYWQQEGYALPEALRLAQCWLRDTSSQQKAKYFKQSDLDLYRELILYPADRFAHPYHWAAFTYMGA